MNEKIITPHNALKDTGYKPVNVAELNETDAQHPPPHWREVTVDTRNKMVDISLVKLPGAFSWIIFFYFD